MKLRNKHWVVVILFGCLLIASILVFLQIRKNTTENQIASNLYKVISSKNISFDGLLSTNGRYITKTSFSTRLSNDSSVTKFKTSLQVYGGAGVDGEIRQIGPKTYIRLSGIDGALKRLPADPLSNAIKSNLSSLNKEYKNKWILIDQKNSLDDSASCFAMLKANISSEKIKTAYSRNAFIENVSEAKIITEGKPYKKLSFSINDKFASFLSEVSGYSTETKCSAKGMSFNVTQDESGLIKMLGINGPDFDIEIKNIDDEADALSIVEPKSATKFSRLKSDTDSLFIYK